MLNFLNLKSFPSYLFFVIASSLSILCTNQLFSLAYSILLVDTESLQYASVQLEKNAEGVSSNFNQNQGNSADPGGPVIVLKNGTPIIYGLFFL
jgi:hypothetical protein